METKNYKNYIKVYANTLLDSLDRVEKLQNEGVDDDIQKIILKATLIEISNSIQEILNK